jgi:RNA polymerase sigma-70 factor (ECF subfamily)
MGKQRPTEKIFRVWLNGIAVRTVIESGAMRTLLADSFEATVAKQQERILAICRRILGETGEAEEAAQDAFLKLHRHWEKMEDDVGPWLARTAVNTSLDRRRSPRRSVELVELPDRRAGPAELAEIAQRWARVKRGLAALPERERAAITLRDIEGLTTAEVAALLETTEGTVRSQIAAARIKLRRLL